MKSILLIFISIIALYIARAPRVTNYLFPQARQHSLGKIINSARVDGLIDAQEFWETREFYYPGTFYTHKNSLTEAKVSNFVLYQDLLLTKSEYYPILYYDSPKWQSLELLVKTNELSEAIKYPEGEVLYEDQRHLVVREGDTTYLYFLKSLDDLRITNGFIYRDDDILKNYEGWLSISLVLD